MEGRHAAAGVDGLRESSRRPRTSPSRLAAEAEALVCELRRAHPRWGARRIAFEVAQRGVGAPSRATVHRVLVTITSESAAAAFGGVIALSGIAASLFFKASAPVATEDAGKPTTPAAWAGPVRSGCCSELRAAVEAYAAVLEAPHAEWRGSVMRGRAAGGQRRKGLLIN